MTAKTEDPGKAAARRARRAGARKKAARMVKVSALALAAVKWPSFQALAQTVKINCAGQLDIGNLIACNSGKYTIAPDGGHTNTGCLIINTTAVAATCVAQTKTGPITQDLVISISAGSFTMSSAGTGKVTVKNMKIQRRGSPTSANPLTITSGAIAKTMTFDVGGTVHFKNNQPAGSYTGNVQITTKLN